MIVDYLNIISKKKSQKLIHGIRSVNMDQLNSTRLINV